MIAKQYTIICLTVGILLSIGGASVQAASESNFKTAPEWRISQWINSEPLQLSDLAGKVVVVEFFQLWCPGCNNFSVPLMLEWEQKYRDNPDIQFISIHTVFEGHEYQNPKRLAEYVQQKRILHPVGIDKHELNQHTPKTMQLYKTRGTPEMAIIDKQGYIRFQKFGTFNQRRAEKLIENLLTE